MDISWISEILSHWGMGGMFFLVMLEYACFPLPSEVLLPLAGLACAMSGTPAALAVFLSTLAGLLGSVFCYLAGRFGQTLLSKFLSRFPKAEEKLAKTRAFGASFGGLSVMAARVVPLCRTWISFAAGLAAQPLPEFLLYSSMGIIVWNTLLLGSGYLLFGAGSRLAPGTVKWLPFAVLFLIVGLFFLRRVLLLRKDR